MKKEKDVKGGGPSPAAIADPRFARVHTDPRFMRMPKNKSKVSIDKRFSHMFSDKNFSDPLGADKRGRAKKKKEKHMLQRYYKVGEGEANVEDETEAPLKSKLVAKSNKKSGGKSGNLVRPKFPGPVAPSKLGLDESDSDEEIDLKPKLKGRASGEKVRSKQVEIAESESDSDEEVGLKSKLKGKKLVKKLVRPISPKLESDSDEEVGLKSKSKGKKSAKKLVRPKSPEPEIDSEEGSEEEIDLNSEESEEEFENGKTQEDDDSEEEDEDDDAERSSSSSSSSSSSESEGEEDVSDLRDQEKVPTASGAETRRLAMMNMDWEHIKAADLLMLMRSFQPKGGRVECVTIYPSEFGIEQLKAEEVHGPSMIFEDEEDDEDEDKEVNMEKLRAYEKNKLKYYYAVVECDTKETANHLYTQCDGLEFERTSNILDLRFIPDDMTFAREPRDVAKEVEDGYKAPEFETRALQHSTVKLTWDDDEPTRVKALRKKFNADELNEMDFRAYLASESSEEEVGDDEDDERPSSPERGGDGDAAKSKKDKYRSLLLGGTTEDAQLPGQKKKKGDVDMEVTFHTGLTELSEKLMQKKEAKKRGDETVWEAYLRKKKEKKSQRKRSKNAKGSDDDYSDEEVASPRVTGQGEADPFFTHDDTGFDDPFFADDAAFPDDSKAAPKKNSKTKAKDDERLKKREEKEQQKKEEERSKAELELLLMDDEGVQGAARGFNLKSKDKKKKKEKGKKRGKKDEADQEEEDKLATADLTDPRFAPLFSNHHYAIDPTNPQFRKSAAQLKILAEAQRRRSQKSDDGGVVASDGLNGDAAALEPSQDRKRKAELSSLVRSLKRKAGKPGLAKQN